MCLWRKKHIEATIKYMKIGTQQKRFYNECHNHPLNAARKLDHGVHKSLGCATPHAFV